MRKKIGQLKLSSLTGSDSRNKLVEHPGTNGSHMPPGFTWVWLPLTVRKFARQTPNNIYQCQISLDWKGQENTLMLTGNGPQLEITIRMYWVVPENKWDSMGIMGFLCNCVSIQAGSGFQLKFNLLPGLPQPGQVSIFNLSLQQNTSLFMNCNEASVCLPHISPVVVPEHSHTGPH